MYIVAADKVPRVKKKRDIGNWSLTLSLSVLPPLLLCVGRFVHLLALLRAHIHCRLLNMQRWQRRRLWPWDGNMPVWIKNMIRVFTWSISKEMTKISQVWGDFFSARSCICNSFVEEVGEAGHMVIRRVKRWREVSKAARFFFSRLMSLRFLRDGSW